MIKLTYCLRRTPEMDFEEFNRYWREEHSPLVREHADALAISRYVQVPRLQEPDVQQALSDGHEAQLGDFDGVAEVYFEGTEEMQAAFETPEAAEALQALLEDEKEFIDVDNSVFWFGNEREIIE